MICLPLAPLWLLVFTAVVVWLKSGGRIRVVDAIDGDTLLAARGFEAAHRVRLVGVDAPELGSCFGDVARDWMSQKVRGAWVIARFQGTDLYRRPLVYLTVEGRDLGEELLLAGLARAVPFRHERQGAYLAAERLARREGRGMWAARAKRERRTRFRKRR
ncbi:MAG: thermonuclease family protein [Acidobacteriota bacterium]